MIFEPQAESHWEHDSNKVSVRRLLFILACLVYTIIFNWSYAHTESVIFLYQGYEYHPTSFFYYLIAYITALLPALTLPIRIEKPSQAAIILLYVTWYIPIIFVPLNFIKTLQGIWMMSVTAVLCFWLLRLVLRLKIPKIRPIRFSNRSFDLLLLFSCLVLTFIVAAMNHFKLDLSIDVGYTRRLAARDAIGEGAFAGYAMNWLAGSIAPMAIAYGMAAKKKILVIAGTIGLVAIFSFTGQKLAIATVIMLLVMLWMMRRFRSNYGLLLVTGFALLISLCSYSWLAKGNMLPSESFTRRVVAFKGVSSVYYWQLFINDPVYMRDSALMKILGLPPEPAKSYRVGEEFLGRDDANYDASAWASAFGDFGYAGMLMVTVVIGLFIKLLDHYSSYGNRDVNCLMASYMIGIWGDQALQTSMLSSGIIISIVILYLLSGTKARDHQPALES